jgi:hypothetical protein
MRKRIFVFGSNLAGFHGAGSAAHAFKNHGARHGCGIGLRGSSYAIPTKDKDLQVLPLARIYGYVENFLDFAREHPEMEFDIVAIGCGLAGYKPAQIAPMFKSAPKNCKLPPAFSEALAA